MVGREMPKFSNGQLVSIVVSDRNQRHGLITREALSHNSAGIQYYLILKNVALGIESTLPQGMSIINLTLIIQLFPKKCNDTHYETCREKHENTVVQRHRWF